MGSQITGFDIGEKTLKIAHFANGKLKKTVTIDVPDNMVSGGQIVSADGMSDLIEGTARKYSIPRKNAAVLLPSSLVYVRTVIIPVMADSQLRYNLPFEFRDYITQDKNKYVYDYEVLDVIKGEDGKPKEMKIFACATLKSTIERYRAILAHAGYTLSVAIPEEYAYSKLCRGDMGKTACADGPCAIVDFGQDETRIHMLIKGQYDSKRVVELGMRHLDNIIADVTLTDAHVACGYKIDNYDNVLNNARCVDFYNSLAAEIVKSVNFFNYNNRDYELKDIYLTGGGSAIAHLIAVVSEVTGLEIHTAEDLLGSAYAGAEDPYLSLRAVCCAAAIK